MKQSTGSFRRSLVNREDAGWNIITMVDMVSAGKF